MKNIINTTQAPAAIGPYVQGIDLGNMLFLSGQIPINPATGEMVSGIEPQTQQALNNVLAVLTSANCTLSNVVKSTVFVTDLNDFAVVNKIYEAFFVQHSAPFPARSCVQVARLPKDALIEIEVIAVR